MRGPCRFKKSDIIRATEAARAAGMQIARLEIGKDGTIVVVPREAAGASPEGPYSNLERVVGVKRRRAV
jgi:hypothetical protein